MTIGNIIAVHTAHHGPLDRKGGDYALYQVAKVNRVNIIAHNLGTCCPVTLRRDQVVPVAQDLHYLNQNMHLYQITK